MKNKVGAVQVYMTRELLNAMLYCLDAVIRIDNGGEWTICAERIKNKILKHARRFTSNDTESVVVYFYEKEAAILLKAFALFVALHHDPVESYFEQISCRKNVEGESK